MTDDLAACRERGGTDWMVGERVEIGDTAESYDTGLVVAEGFNWETDSDPVSWVTVVWSNGGHTTVSPAELRALGSNPLGQPKSRRSI